MMKNVTGEIKEDTWFHGTPGSEYPERRCLGMIISDSGQRNMAQVEQRIKQLFPDRINTDRPLLPMFECCGSLVIPSFNNHPDTTLEDVRLVYADVNNSI